MTKNDTGRSDANQIARAVEIARKAARSAALGLVSTPHPEWWGPVADLYGAVGLTMKHVTDTKGRLRGIYEIHPDAAAILTLEAVSDAEAYDLAKHISASKLIARQPLPDGLVPFVVGVLTGQLPAPTKPTQSPVKFWHRDTTVHFLVGRLKRELGLHATQGIGSENEATKRKSKIPSLSGIISEEFNRVAVEMQRAGVPIEGVRVLQVTQKSVQTIWANKNVPARLREALACRRHEFSALADRIGAAVTIEQLLSLGD